MRYSVSILGAVALCVSDVAAFPYAAMEVAAKAQRDPSAAQSIEQAVAQHANKRAVGFNAAEQYVSNQGAHAFVPPTNVNTPGGDQRGPCPGLNAMGRSNSKFVVVFNVIDPSQQTTGIFPTTVSLLLTNLSTVHTKVG